MLNGLRGYTVFMYYWQGDQRRMPCFVDHPSYHQFERYACNRLRRSQVYPVLASSLPADLGTHVIDGLPLARPASHMPSWAHRRRKQPQSQGSSEESPGHPGGHSSLRTSRINDRKSGRSAGRCEQGKRQYTQRQGQQEQCGKMQPSYL